MPSERQRQLHRERKSLARRQQARQAEARETQRQQAAAEARRAFAHRRHRHVAAFSIWALAVVMAVTHVFEHAGTLRIMSPGLEDFFIGWPMAAVLGIVGAVAYGR